MYVTRVRGNGITGQRDNGRMGNGEGRTGKGKRGRANGEGRTGKGEPGRGNREGESGDGRTGNGWTGNGRTVNGERGMENRDGEWGIFKMRNLSKRESLKGGIFKTENLLKRGVNFILRFKNRPNVWAVCGKVALFFLFYDTESLKFRSVDTSKTTRHWKSRLKVEVCSTQQLCF